MTDLIKEQKLLENVTHPFKIKGRVIRDRRVEVFCDKETVSSVLLFAKTQLGYIHLAHITCIDWIDDNKFELVYTIWSPEEKIHLFVKTKIDRENPEMENIDRIWDQANTYEREMREMYGIEFPGLVGEHDFALEDWDDIPPMRKDFDTHHYAQQTYYNRPGREDAKDVREALVERSGTEVPDFAKKYSRER
jgi:NADH-quinone oxidoreductase subunit C